MQRLSSLQQPIITKTAKRASPKLKKTYRHLRKESTLTSWHYIRGTAMWSFAKAGEKQIWFHLGSIGTTPIQQVCQSINHLLALQLAPITQVIKSVKQSPELELNSTARTIKRQIRRIGTPSPNSTCQTFNNKVRWVAALPIQHICWPKESLRWIGAASNQQACQLVNWEQELGPTVDTRKVGQMVGHGITNKAFSTARRTSDFAESLILCRYSNII